MKRLLLILLLLAIPFQYTWSAAAVYCQHEPGNVSHFGHHTHQHQAQKSDPDGAGKAKQFHNDCEYCHMYSHATVIQATLGLPPATPQNHAQAVLPRYLNPIPDAPKRPDWLLVA